MNYMTASTVVVVEVTVLVVEIAVMAQCIRSEFTLVSNNAGDEEGDA